MSAKKSNPLDNTLKVFAKTSFVVFIGIIISKIITYLYRVIIARSFGPEVYGLFSLALVIAGLFAAISSLGLSEGILRYISLFRGKKENHKIRYIFRLSSTISALTSLIFGIALFFLSSFISITIFHNASLIIFLKISSILVPALVFSNLLLNVMRAYEKIESLSFILNILQNFIKLAVLIILIYIGFNNTSTIISYILGTLSIPLAAYFYCKYKLPQVFMGYTLNGSLKNKISSELLSYSWPVMLFSIVSNIFYWTDSLFLGYFKGVLPVGFYNAAVPIALLPGVIQEIFMYLFLPLVTKEFSKNNLDLVREISQQTGKWIFTLGLPLFIIIFLFPGAFLNIIFGSQYIIAAASLRFLVVGVFFASFIVVSQNLLSMYGKSRLILMDIILASIVNIILDVILINRPVIFSLDNSLGMVGAALATMISTIFLNLLFLFQTRHYLSIVPLRRKMLQVFIVSIIPTMLLIALRQFIQINFLTIILQTIFFMLLYFFFILLSGGFDRNDMMIIDTVRRKIFK